MKITLKPGLEIGDSCPPFIIAEVGSNWKTLEDCLRSIVEAKACGAAAVKFQLFDYEALYGVEIADKENKHGFRNNHLPVTWLPLLKERADKVGIEFMCSAFSPELIDAVDPYVNIHKLASAEMTHVRMLEKLKRIGKPVIMSTGASGEADIARSLEILTPTPTVLLYCIASYPAQEIHLDTLNLIRSRFHVLTGYSDHTTNIAPIPKLAIERGACVLEKHFTATLSDTPDRPHSLDPAQFKRMVDDIRGDTKPVLGFTREERGMILRHNRRLIATRDIAEGDALTEGFNFGIYRSLMEDTHAYSPFMINEIKNRAAKRDIKAGHGIGPGDV